jgi:cell division septation protein DedD
MNMKRQLVACLLCAGLCAPASADYQSALAAYRRGDFVVALKELRPLARAGMSEAQSVLALMYEYGQGVAADMGQAVQWYRRAAEGGHLGAQFILAGLYARGIGVPRDDAEALRWYRRAARRGHDEAQYQLARMLEDGRGTAQDMATALHWYQEAAANGNRKAMQRLASPPQPVVMRTNPTPPLPKRAAPTGAAPASAAADEAAQPSLGGVRVQLAAFRSAERALQAWTALRDAHPDVLAGLNYRIAPATAHGGAVWHRLEVGPLPSMAAARRLCRVLERGAADCLALRGQTP